MRTLSTARENGAAREEARARADERAEIASTPDVRAGGAALVDPARRRALLTDGIIGLLSLIWGTTYFVIKQGLADLPPFTAAGARFTLAAIVFTGLAAVLAKREGGSRPTLMLSLAIGLLNFACSYAIVYLTETKLPSGLVSVLWGTSPMMLAVLSHAFLPGGRIGAREWMGFVVGFAGVVVLFATDLVHVGPGGVAFGALLMLSPAVAAVGQIYIKKHGSQVNSMILNRNGMWIAAPLLVLAALVFERDARVVWSTTAVASVIYLALVGTVTAFGLFFWALRHAPAHRMGVIAYLTPLTALLVGTLVGDEPFGWHTFVGSGLVLGSVAVVMRAKRAARG